MLRMRMAAAAAAAVVALLAAACGDDGGEAATPDEPQGQATTATTAATTTTTAASEPDDGGSEAAPDTDGDGAALLASALTQLDGVAVRGEATFDLAPGFELSTSFESDVEGDLAAVVELPPGFDPEATSGGEAEFRYVGGAVYVRPPVSEATLAELGLDEAWFVAELPPPDPMSDVVGSAGGLLCVFPQTADVFFDQCDPLGDAAGLLEVARDPVIVGREVVRGTEATRVRFQVSLRDLAGGALGETFGVDEADADSDDGAFFDDSSSDPLAEGMEEFFSLLDSGFQAEAWIDGDSLIRRLAFDLASMFAGLAGPDEGIPSSVITIEFFDFGADIEVDAPPPEAIVDQSMLGGPPGVGTGGGGAGPAVEPIEDPYGDTYDETDEPGP